MNKIKRPLAWAACALGLTLAGSAAWAERPDFAGGPHAREQREDHGDRHERQRRDERDHDRREHRRHDERGFEPRAELRAGPGAYFGDRYRGYVHEYYAPRVSAGRCPPGLAKKHNGCLPPGQARPWVIGQRLPAGIVTYPVPIELQRRMGPPPPGYEFVRVAGDILMIAVGTSLVIDAIEDLGGR